MEAESVSEYLKSGYAPISADAADRLENYGFVWNLRGSAWERPFDRSPDGLQKDEYVDEAAIARRLAVLNAARAHAIGPLSELGRVYDAACELMACLLPRMPHPFAELAERCQTLLMLKQLFR
jgi:hypothetical protein